MEYVINITAVDEATNTAATVLTVRTEASKVDLKALINGVLTKVRPGIGEAPAARYQGAGLKHQAIAPDSLKRGPE